jgi:cellulose biosynthesis protein BcsQ
MRTDTAAVVGATGGAGTTRTAVELAGVLAADGRDVALLDAAYATQGLSDYVGGTLHPDLTALVTDATEEPLAAGLVDLSVAAPGRVVCCPTHAPFERLARAKRPAAAEHLERRIAEAANQFDAVLVDTPPLAANQAVAAVTAADRVALVAPGTTRGADGVQRVGARIADVGAAVDVVLATRGDLSAADVTVPASEVTDPAAAPACLHDDAGGFGAAVAEAAEATLATDLDVAYDDGGFLDGVGLS